MRWGEVENRQVRLVRLHWHALTLTEGFALRDLETRLPEEPGVYAFEGSHDAHPNGCVLYVGRAGKIENAETLRGRTPASLCEKIGWAPPGSSWRPWAQFPERSTQRKTDSACVSCTSRRRSYRRRERHQRTEDRTRR